MAWAETKVRTIRLALAGVAVIALAACASNRVAMEVPDYSALPQAQSLEALAGLTAAYQSNPNDRTVLLHYAAALRAHNQSGQAVTVLEGGMAQYPGDPDISVAYAKALTAHGRFEQALNVIDNALRPEAPDWNALSVRGAVLDQLGRHDEARLTYQQALALAPGEASLEANLGLSYSMTNDLGRAEQHLRRATELPGATSRIRQNLALILGLQGRFEEARAIYAAELPADEVEANMSYVRSLLTQQNRWDLLD
jgi:Flp pilus assembly protein TadD